MTKCLPWAAQRQTWRLSSCTATAATGGKSLQWHHCSGISELRQAGHHLRKLSLSTILVATVATAASTAIAAAEIR